MFAAGQTRVGRVSDDGRDRIRAHAVGGNGGDPHEPVADDVDVLLLAGRSRGGNLEGHRRKVGDVLTGAIGTRRP